MGKKHVRNIAGIRVRALTKKDLEMLTPKEVQSLKATDDLAGTSYASSKAAEWAAKAMPVERSSVAAVEMESGGVVIEVPNLVFLDATCHTLTAAPKGLLVDLFVPSDRAGDILYNLQGRYSHWVAKHGVRKAGLIFLSQSIGTIAGIWVDWGLAKFKVFKSLRKS